jgi:hypothetical protein
MAPELRTVLAPLLFHEDPTEEKDEIILNRAIWIWITANSYVRLDDDGTVDSLHEKQLSLNLRYTHARYNISIHASTLEESIICLNYLAGLQDTHFEQMKISYIYECEPQLCLFGVDNLDKVLQNSARQNVFNCMIFTPDHCRTDSLGAGPTRKSHVQGQVLLGVGPP